MLKGLCQAIKSMYQNYDKKCYLFLWYETYKATTVPGNDFEADKGYFENRP